MVSGTDRPTATITVLVTDLVGSTELLRHGPEAFDDLRRAHLAAARRAVAGHGGREVKSTGDGILVTFTSAADAAAAAVATQIAVADLQHGDPRQPHVRVGLACGEATSEDGDWYGRPVIEATRLCAAATGGQILTTAIVEALVGGRGGHRFLPRGELTLKGFDEPTTVVEIGWSAPDPRTSMPRAASIALVDEIVGRDDDLAVADALWQEAASGQRRALLVSGEPGIGKTCLVSRIAAEAHDGGATVLWGRCDEDLAVPYQPIAEALRAWLPSADEEAADEVARSELGRLLPEADARVASALAVVGSADDERQRLIGALDAFLRRLAAHAPVVLVLDDLHWASAPTLQVLRHLVRDPAPLPLLVVGTYRSTELDRTHPLAAVLADLRRERIVTRLSLRDLAVDGVERLVAMTVGGDLDERTGLAEAIHDETEGNPFFVDQVLQHLVESGALREVGGQWTTTVELSALGLPEGVREVVGRRLSTLSDLTNTALTVGAVIGHDFDLPTVEAVLDGVTGDEVLGALEAALAAQLLSEAPGAPGRFAFVHSLVRQTLLSELTAARRSRLHRRIADALAGRANVDPAVCAHHFIEGATTATVRDAARWTALAMEELWSRLAFEEAIGLGDRALQVLDSSDEPLESERGAILARRALHLQFQGATDDAKALADVAIDHARRSRDAETMAIAIEARYTWGRAGMPDPDARAVLDEAIAIIGDRDQGSLARVLSIRSMWRAVDQGEGWAADDDARRAVELGWTALSPAWLSRIATTRCLVLLGSPDLAAQHAALDDLRRVHARLRTPDAGLGVFSEERILVVLAMAEGDRAMIDRTLESAGGEISAVDGRIPTATRSMWAAMVALADGRFDDAEERAAGLLEMANDVNFRNSWAALTFRIAYERGRAGELIPIIEGMMAATPGLVSLRSVLADAYVDAGRLDEAAAILTELAADGCAAVPRDITWSASLAHLATVAASVRDAESAATLYELLLPYAGQLIVVAWGVFCHGAADRFLAMGASLGGRFDEADERFGAALSLEESARCPALAARTRYWWARSLVDRGDIVRARPLLDAARESAVAIGQQSVVACLDRLVATAPTSRRRAT